VDSTERSTSSETKEHSEDHSYIDGSASRLTSKLAAASTSGSVAIGSTASACTASAAGAGAGRRVDGTSYTDANTDDEKESETVATTSLPSKNKKKGYPPSPRRTPSQLERDSWPAPCPSETLDSADASMSGGTQEECDRRAS
jgi:hypothetical protein